MPSPRSASCHAHTLNLSLPEQKTITLSDQEAPVCSTQKDVRGVLVFLLQKKKPKNKTKNIQANRTARKERQRTAFLTVLISSFLLPGKPVLFHFFPCNSNNWKPFQQLLPRQPQHLQPPGSPGTPDMLHCRSNLPTRKAEPPSEREKEQQQIYSRIITLSATDHLMLTRPIPSVLQASSHTGHHQQTTDVLSSHEKKMRVLSCYTGISHFLQIFLVSQSFNLNTFPHADSSQLP